jgi:uncharacterized membrane protein (UPF0127 family)
MKSCLIKFKIKDKEFKIKAKKCDNIFSQISGLMFRKKSLPLLFIFRKPKLISIHSFFCVPFVAIWFSEDKIIKTKIVSPNSFSIKPEKYFNKILEIPINCKEFKIIFDFIDGQEHLNTKTTS